jgi:hypothetical protein
MNATDRKPAWRSGRLRFVALLLFTVLAACGGGGSGDAPAPAPGQTGSPPPAPTGANVLAITVDRGPDGTAFNTPFVSVTVCVPGTSTCQTIDHVLVDTGSYGLRLAASAVAQPQSLPIVSNNAGAPVGECAHFVKGFAWGSVRRADVKLAGETAANLPVQIIGDPAAGFAAVPGVCSSTGADFGADLGMNGILGVGLFNQDCPSCSASSAPAVYFACTASGCSPTVLPLDSQVANPVAAFASDNNGIAITLPAVAQGGVATLSGSLIFGIGTQANNQLGSATVYATDRQGNFTTTYKGASYTAFLDSGSNAVFFRDLSIPQCLGFYCPPTPLALSAVNTAFNGASGSVNFTVESIQSLNRNAAAANVGADAGLGRTFDWGLPFFFGRTVFVAISGASTPKGSGPYWAY